MGIQPDRHFFITTNFVSVLELFISAPLFGAVFGGIFMLVGSGFGYLYGYSTNHKELGIEIGIICGMVATPFVWFGFGRITDSTFVAPILTLVIGSVLGKIIGNRLGIFLIRRDIQ